MKKFIIRLGVVVFVVGMGLLVFWPISGPAAWRQYDMNWQPLALTEAENWCAGNIGINNGFKKNSKEIADCIERSTLDNEQPSVSRSLAWACTGIVDGGYRGSIIKCKNLIDKSELWLIVSGGFTSAWDDTRPRPVVTNQDLLEDEWDRENRANSDEDIEEEEIKEPE